MGRQQQTDRHDPADDETLELTAAQRGMWFAENMSADYSVTVAQYLDIRDVDRPLDVETLARVIVEVGRSSEMAFTRIVEVDGVPRQIVDQTIKNEVEILDFRHHADPVAAARQWMNDDYRQNMDLLTDRLVAATVLKVADDRHFWYVRAHHIALDGYAALVRVFDILNTYNAAVAGTEYVPKPAATLAEIVDDDQKYIAGSRRARDRDYWVERVADLPERVTLAQSSAAAPLSPDNRIASAEISAEQQDTVDLLAASLNSSAAVILTAGFSAYLARMAGTDDIVLSLPVTGRATARIKRAAGMLSNMLPIRLRQVTGLSMRELVDQAQLELTGALRHQRYRFEDIRQDAGLRDANTASFGPIVNMMFFDRPLELVGATVDYQILTSGILEDLRLNLYQACPGARLVVDLHGNPNLYGATELQTHLHRFLLFLDRVLDHLDAPIGAVDVMMPGERADMLALGAGPELDAEDPTPHLLDGFVRRATDHPDAAAIRFGGRTWTYREFDQMRLLLAAHLRRHGVGRGDAVVVALDRGPTQVATIYAVLTLGAAYVPVNPDQPAHRRGLIAETVGARVIVDADHLAEHTLDPVRDATDRVDPLEPLGLCGGGDEAAYVIFTSGSTGTPKGVQVGHRAVVNRLAWMQADYPLAAGDPVLYKTPFTFDVSVWELLWPLAQGACMVIARPAGHRDPEYLYDLISRERVAVVHFVPSMLDVYAEVVASDGRSPLFADSVRHVFTSGEALPRLLADHVLADSGAALVNLYGPTEAAVDITGCVVAAGDGPVPIGRPVTNSTVYVLDTALQPVPSGVAGELYLAGCQLADGYVGRTDLTADRFLADPYGPVGTRMYRTGDLVRWDDDGMLAYLGRTDFQIKIRGQRVEPGEIEAVLDAMAGVDASAVVARTDLGPAPVLVAYLRSEDASVSEPTALGWCKRHLPSHMVPVAVVVLDHFPLNSSGKLDRKQLPAPDLHSDGEHVPAVTPVERALAGLVAEMLDAEQIGLRDNIFARGGDSLMAARLVSRARVEHGIALELTDVFTVTDIGELATRAVRHDAAAYPQLAAAAPRPDVIPLSYSQTRLWFVNRMDPGAATYNMPGAVRLGAEVDIEALRAAIGDLLERHETLRTRFGSHVGEPVQEILSPEEALAEIDLDVAMVGDRIDEHIAATVSRGFDLVREIPFRGRIFADADGFVVVFVLHHIAGDGFSLFPLISDLVGAYARRRSAGTTVWEPLPVQYADYAIWQRGLLGELDAPTELALSGLRFWEAELVGMPDLLALPTDRPRPHVATGTGGYVDARIDADLGGGIRRLARDHHVTPFAVLHAALALVLSRWAEVDGVAIGTAVAGRDDPATTEMVGMFVNTVVLRTQVSPADTVLDLVERAHGVRSRAMRHAVIPFEWVVDAVAPERSAAHSPLFQVSLTLVPGHATAAAEFDEQATVLDARVPAAKFDLSLSVTDKVDSDGYDIEYSYAADIFDRSTIERVARQLETVLAAMVADPRRVVGTLDLVDAAQRQTLVAGRPAAVAPVTLRDLFRIGVAQADPDAVAIDGAAQVTWSMLDVRSGQLARDLIADGVGPGDVVAICIPRSHHSVIATVAVAKTGAAFVSIDPAHPPARRSEILSDSGAVVGLSTAESSAQTPAGVEWRILDDPATEFRLAGHRGAPVADSELTRPLHVDDLAYLIYTSGSTGRPKAAALGHRGLANLVANQRRLLRIDRTSTILHVASPSFDASIFEILMALGSGAGLVISPTGVFGGNDLAEVIDRHGVTHAVMTPSALGTLEPASVPRLGRVISVGEACPPDLMRRWVRAGRAFHNLYGPTETTIWATAAGPLADDDEITIGSAVPGVGAVVLDRSLRPVPVGVPGELYLSGPQLARGYHGRRDLTAGRFVADPFGSGGRMYRTGDRVVRTADGDFRYLGRSDFQLKIRGVRIEPGEIEAAIIGHPLVTDAICLGIPGPGGDDVLVAYATLVDGAVGDPDRILELAATELAGHMVPRALVIVESFTLTTAGKIDRRSLPAVDFSSAAAYREPSSQMEMVVAGIFGQVLGHDRVSADADFFDLGGSSLSATKVTARLSALLDRSVPVKQLFERPTVAALAAALATGPGGAAVPRLHARTRTELVHVSGMQRGLWLLNRADPESAAYNVAMALRLSGPLDVDALIAATADVGRRQEALRTTYPMIGGEPVHLIMPPDAPESELHLTVREVTGSTTEAIAEITGVGFDITARPPVRAVLLRESAHEHVLVFVIHHISADGASMPPLARDLMSAYAARSSGVVPTWQPLPVQYADFSLWLSERLAVADGAVTEEERQFRYWDERLAGLPDRLDLPTDRPRPATPTFAGDVVDFEIPATTFTALDALSREYHTTHFMVAHAVLAVLLARMSGRDDIVVGTPYAGRGEPLLEDVVGMFVNTLALRTRVAPADRFVDLLERVRNDDLADMSHADVAFDGIVSRVLKRPPTSYNPIYQVMFAYQNVEFPSLELGGLRVSVEDEELTAAKVDLQLTLFPNDPAREAHGGAMRAQFLYATDLFEAATVARLAARFVRLLGTLVDDPEQLVGDVDIRLDDESGPTAVTAVETDDTVVPLVDLIADAAAHDSGSIAIFELSFGELAAYIESLRPVVPDGDSALVMALMTLVPPLATAGASGLDEALGTLRDRACVVSNFKDTPAAGSF